MHTYMIHLPGRNFVDSPPADLPDFETTLLLRSALIAGHLQSQLTGPSCSQLQRGPMFDGEVPGSQWLH